MLPTLRRNRLANVPRYGYGLLPSLDLLFDDMLTRPEEWSTWIPATDMYETDEAYMVEIDLPGFDKKDVELTVENGILTVTGEHVVREKDEEKEGVTYHVKERMVTKFTRSFTLPRAIDANAVEASFQNGVLAIRLPKLEEAKPRKIEVKVK